MRQRKIEIPSMPGLKLAFDGVVVLAGPAGSGKTTMALQMLGDLRPAVMFSFEESFSETLADKLRRLELRYDDLFIEMPATVREAYSIIDDLRPRAVLVDSLRASTFTIADLSALAEAKGLVVIIVQHVTKQGQVGGDAAIEFECDVVIRVAEGRWTLTKSRYQPLAEGKIAGVA